MFYRIIDSEFNNCYSKTHGGAITMVNIPNSEITGSYFSNNRAEKTGGAILFYCQNFGPREELCSLDLKDSTFNNNSAGEQGGALRWNFYEPKMSNLKFNRNKALLYGNDIAAVAKRLMRFSSKEEL